jgi:hypothetical protein
MLFIYLTAYCRPTPPYPGRGMPRPYYDFIAIAIAIAIFSCLLLPT